MMAAYDLSAEDLRVVASIFRAVHERQRIAAEQLEQEQADAKQAEEA